MTKLTQNISRAMADRDISLARLAQLSGVQQSTLHRIMKGLIDEPRTSTLAPLAQFLGVSVQTLRDGDLPAQLTFHNSTIDPETPHLHNDGSSSNVPWDRDSHLRAFDGYLSDSAPADYLNWYRDIEGNCYRLDYCSERLAVDLISFSRPAPASHPRPGQLDFSGLFNAAAGHLVDLFMIHVAYPNLTPLLLILSPVIPDENLASVRKLLASARSLGVNVRFATTGLGAAQAAMKIESKLLNESGSISND